MACRITELVLDCRNPEVLADFWCQVLGFVVLQTGEDDSVEIGPAGTDLDDPGLMLVFSRTTQPKQTKLRLHFDVNAVDCSQDEELQRLLKFGALKADVGQTGQESWHVLADPEGNEFCLLRRTVKPASLPASACDRKRLISVGHRRRSLRAAEQPQGRVEPARRPAADGH